MVYSTMPTSLRALSVEIKMLSPTIGVSNFYPKPGDQVTENASRFG